MLLSQNSELKSVADFRRWHARAGFWVTDIDNTMVLEASLEQPGLPGLKSRLRSRSGRFGFAVATGRSLAGVQAVFTEHKLPAPDVIIASVGTRIYYDLRGETVDTDWDDYLNFRWNREATVERLATVAGIQRQPVECQRKFKLSYWIDPLVFSPAALDVALGDLADEVNVVLSRNRFLDVLPKRASKGRAIHFLSQKWGIPASRILVSGDSGNDLDMLTGGGKAIVVGNYSLELEILRNQPGIYFSPLPGATGILDGLAHWGFPNGENTDLS